MLLKIYYPCYPVACLKKNKCQQHGAKNVRKMRWWGTLVFSHSTALAIFPTIFLWDFFFKLFKIFVILLIFCFGLPSRITVYFSLFFLYYYWGAVGFLSIVFLGFLFIFFEGLTGGLDEKCWSCCGQDFQVTRTVTATHTLTKNIYMDI